MRGLIEGLENPHPLGLSLPAPYQEDDFAQRFVSAFDGVLAPILMCLDNFDAYLDPWLTPDDFLDWLSGWVDVVLDEEWPIERKRTFVARAVELYRLRGTIRGVSELVTLYTGVEPEIADSGGAAWSGTPGGDLPGVTEPHLTVRVKLPNSAGDEVRTIETLVAAAKPAHVPHTVEVLSS